MEPGINSNSETSKNTEDDLHQEHKALEKPKEDDNMGVGRSYECTFCKRGFTNAQALGGHMNIHRKDKAAKGMSKPRNIHNEPPVSLIGNVDYSRYFPVDPAISSQINLDNYKVYLPSPNPSFQTANNIRPMMMDLGPKEPYGLIDENLSLRIGLTSSTPTIEGIGGEQNEKKNDEVDLELRLGHDP